MSAAGTGVDVEGASGTGAAGTTAGAGSVGARVAEEADGRVARAVRMFRRRKGRRSLEAGTPSVCPGYMDIVIS
jgi:hypothetical protein